MEISDCLRKRLREQRQESARRFRKVRGAADDEVDAVAQDVAGRYETLLSELSAEFEVHDGGTGEAHRQWLAAHRLQVEQAFVSGFRRPPPPRECLCLPIFNEQSSRISVTTSCDGDCVENDAHVDATSNTANPRLEVNGPGPGARNSAELTVEFAFDVNPGSDGEYCIVPVCQLSGYWLAWSWGNCEVSADESQAEVYVEKSIEVVQPFNDIKFALALSAGGVPIHAHEEIVLDRTEAGGSAVQAGVSFNGFPALRVHLRGNDPATVRLRSTLRVAVEGYGKALIDMKTSPDFYLRAPQVGWGPTLCFD